MRLDTRYLRGLALLLAAVCAGCGGTPQSGQVPGDTDGVTTPTDDSFAGTDDAAQTQFVFLEDENPAVADLPYVADELITQTLPGADPSCVEAVFTENDAVVLHETSALETTLVRVDPARFVETAAALAAHPLIEGVHKNYLFDAQRVPDDPEFAAQDYLALIHAEAAWDTTTGSTAIVLAILDTGVDAAHPDLAARLRDGWNTFTDSNDTSDVAGHGTSVAGTAGAVTDNAEGVAGVNWLSPIMPLRVTNLEGLASAQAIATAMVWAVDHGARVINVSFAPLQSDETVRRAAQYVRNAGGLVFVSAGNDGAWSPGEDEPAILFVGATNGDNELASFSSTGPFVDLVAPGAAIRAPAAGGGYRTVSGTSFASPVAAGVASLVWSVNPDLRPATVADILRTTATDLGTPGRDDGFGTGLIDADAAVRQARLSADAPDDLAPPVAITAPIEGETIHDVITVSAEATDLESGVADVVLYVDGEPIATDTFAPYRFALDAAALVEGVHTLTCVGTDAAGNAAESVNVSVQVGAPADTSRCIGQLADLIAPRVRLEFPIDGTTVAGSVGIRAVATDNAALARATLLVDGVPQEHAALHDVRATIDFLWLADSAGAGTHEIVVRVGDEAGNKAEAVIYLTKR